MQIKLPYVFKIASCTRLLFYLYKKFRFTVCHGIKFCSDLHDHQPPLSQQSFVMGCSSPGTVSRLRFFVLAAGIRKSVHNYKIVYTAGMQINHGQVEGNG